MFDINLNLSVVVIAAACVTLCAANTEIQNIYLQMFCVGRLC
jgi:hypothetical protein